MRKPELHYPLRSVRGIFNSGLCGAQEVKTSPRFAGCPDCLKRLAELRAAGTGKKWVGPHHGPRIGKGA